MDLIEITVIAVGDDLPVRPTRRSTETWWGAEYALVREVGTRTVWAECALCREVTDSRGTNGPGYAWVRDRAAAHLYEWHQKDLTPPAAQ